MSSASPHSRSPAPDAASLAGADASPTVDAVAGAAGALLALLSTYPLMTLNTRQHTERGARGADSKLENTKKHRITMLDELRLVANEDGGLKGLYRGIEPAVIGTVTSQTVYNYFYAVLRNANARRKLLRSSKGDASPSALESLAIASVAGAINVLLTIPIWTVCVRMQAERKNEGEGKKPRSFDAKDEKFAKDENSTGVSSFFSRVTSSFTTSARGSRQSQLDGSISSGTRKKTFLETTVSVWDENGVAGFWRGVVPSLMMVSNPALQYAFYESAGDFFRRRRARVREVAGSNPTVYGVGIRKRPVPLTAWEVFLAASLAKMGATVLTYPVLLVKTRLQASKGKRSDTKESNDADASYDGAFDALRRIAKEEGILAFYRGMGTKMTQTVFAAALMFVTKEEIAKGVRTAHAKVAARRERLLRVG